MRRRRSRIGRQGGNRMAAVFNLVMATLRVGEIHYNLSTLSQIHSYLGELMCKIQWILKRNVKSDKQELIFTILYPHFF